jgi:hypothetical protein
VICSFDKLKIETYQIQTQDPFAQRLMMTREDRIGQIVKIAATNLAAIVLSFTLALM